MENDKFKYKVSIPWQDTTQIIWVIEQFGLPGNLYQWQFDTNNYIMVNFWRSEDATLMILRWA